MSAFPSAALAVPSGHKTFPIFSRDRVLACGPSAVWQGPSAGPARRLPAAPSPITRFVEPG